MNNNIKKQNMPRWKFILMMTIAVICWAFAFPFIKIGLEELSFINLTIIRLFTVSIIFIVIIMLQSKRFSKIHKKDIPTIFLLGFLGVAIYHLGLNYGEQYISPGAASLIIATIPIFVVIFASIFLNEKINRKTITGILLALTGVALISIWGTKNASLEIKYLTAALAVLIAALMGTFYTIVGKKLLTRYTGLSLTAYAMLFGSLGLLPLLHPSINNSFLNQVTNLSPLGWFSVFFLAVFSTVVGYAIWYIALKIKNASEISVYLYAIPVLSTIISYVWLNEQITAMFILGGTLVIIGLVLVNRKTNKKYN